MVENFCALLSQHLPTLPTEVANCYDPNCLSHLPALDDYAEQLVSTLISCSFPCVSSSKAKSLPGWTDGAGDLKRASCFWHKVWVEAGCPTAGVLSQKTQCRFKYAVRHLIHDKFVRFLPQEKDPSFGVRTSNLTAYVLLHRWGI